MDSPNKKKRIRMQLVKNLGCNGYGFSRRENLTVFVCINRYQEIFNNIRQFSIACSAGEPVRGFRGCPGPQRRQTRGKVLHQTIHQQI